MKQEASSSRASAPGASASGASGALPVPAKSPGRRDRRAYKVEYRKSGSNGSDRDGRSRDSRALLKGGTSSAPRNQTPKGMSTINSSSKSSTAKDIFSPLIPEIASSAQRKARAEFPTANSRYAPSPSSRGENSAAPSSVVMEIFSSPLYEEKPAMVLNDTFLSRVRDTQNLVQDCEKAKAKLERKERDINYNLNALKVLTDRAYAYFEDAKLQSYRQPGGPDNKSKEKIIRLKDEHKEALGALKQMQDKKNKLENDVREAEKTHYSSLQVIQSMLLGAVASAGLLREETELGSEDNESAASTSTSSLSEGLSGGLSQDSLDPSEGSTGVSSKGSEHNSHRQGGQMHHEVLPPNDVHTMLEKIDNQHQARKHLKHAGESLEQHRATYSAQLRDYAERAEAEPEDVVSEFGSVYFQRTNNLSRVVAEAEQAIDTAHQEAIDAGAPNSNDQRSQFAAVQGEAEDGAFSGRNKTHIATVNKKRVQKWLDTTGTDAYKNSVDGGRVDREELAHPFNIAPITNVYDNAGDHVQPSHQARARMRNWNERCENERQKRVKKDKQREQAKYRPRSIEVGI
jgi:hypothetical protein